jgi:hypothetical protein
VIQTEIFSLEKNAFSLKKIKQLILIMLMTALVKSSDSFQAAETNPPAVIEDLVCRAARHQRAGQAACPRSTCALTGLKATPSCRRKNSECFPITPAKWIPRACAKAWKNCSRIYRELGFSNLDVTLPEQKFTNGLVRIKIIRRTNAGTNAESDFGRGHHNLFIAPGPSV